MRCHHTWYLDTVTITAAQPPDKNPYIEDLYLYAIAVPLYAYPKCLHLNAIQNMDFIVSIFMHCVFGTVYSDCI